MITEAELNDLLPLATAWVEEQENYILENGIRLDETILKDSQLLKIEGMEKVRVLAVDEIPLPSNEILRNAVIRIGFIGSDTIGTAFRYGIYVQKAYQRDAKLIVHELTHTMQYERIGGISAFLKQYVQECIILGYPNGPLEQEAINVANQIYP